MTGELAELDATLPVIGTRSNHDTAALPRVVVAGVDADTLRIVDAGHGLDPAVVAHWETMLPAMSGDWGEGAAPIPAPTDHAADVVVLVGLGRPQDGDSAVRLRRAAGTATRVIHGRAAIDFALPAPSPAERQAVLEGALLGGYAYNGLRSDPDRATSRVDLVERASSAEIDRADAAAAAVGLTRTLVSMPANILSPDALARIAVERAAAAGITARVWDEDELKREGFGGIVAVGQGSSRAPRLVRLDYAPPDPRRHLALVGKGVTFDSGGLNLKLTDLEYMNFDMAGAAAALATVVAAARRRLPVRVTAWLALAENVPSGSSQRPSDVIRLRDGTTVEVRDTDAEGRLIMADAIIAACSETPDVLCDIATLTGAQQIALGDRIAALMSNDDPLAQSILDAAALADEPMWRMPLPPALAQGLSSTVADIANKAGRNGGMLTAALFLQHFVNRAERVPSWAHLDICGPAINRGEPYGFTGRGPTGFGVRTLLALAESLGDG